jgi:hypothetical protein
MYEMHPALFLKTGCDTPSESIKDRLDVGLMTEDPLTGHMPRHG